MTYWAIEHEWRRGKWFIDHTTVRMTRGEAWMAWEKWWTEPKKQRRLLQHAGKLRAVKVKIRRVEEHG